MASKWATDIDFSGVATVKGLKAPANASDGAPKSYVDAAAAVRDVPSYAPASLARNWDARRSAYNVNGRTMHFIRSRLAAVAQNTTGFHIVYMSDSSGVGFNGSVFDQRQAVPYRMAKALSRLTGNPYVTSGVSFASCATANVGDKWTVTGTWAQSAGTLVSYSAGTATYVTPEPCTSIEIYCADTDPAKSYTVDGGASVNIPAGAGTNATKKISITGLPYAVHTVVLTVSALTVICGQRCWTPGLNQIHLHNLSYGGANANNPGNLGISWSANVPQGLAFVANGMLGASGVTADVVGICIGSNDLYSGTAPSVVQAGITAMLSYVPGAAPFLVHEMPITGTNPDNAAQLGSRFFTLAESRDCLMLDWNDYVNNPNGSYVNDGQAGADGIHPIFSHQNLIGSWFASVLADRQFVGETNFPNVIGLPGGRYKLIQSGGSYPLRPPVPAGYVDYQGPAQPTGWLVGDTWDQVS